MSNRNLPAKIAAVQDRVWAWLSPHPPKGWIFNPPPVNTLQYDLYLLKLATLRARAGIIIDVRKRFWGKP